MPADPRPAAREGAARRLFCSHVCINELRWRHVPYYTGRDIDAVWDRLERAGRLRCPCGVSLETVSYDDLALGVSHARGAA